MKNVIPILGLILLSTSAYASGSNCCQLWRNQSLVTLSDNALCAFATQAACLSGTPVPPEETLPPSTAYPLGGALTASMGSVPGLTYAALLGDVGNYNVDPLGGGFNGCFWHSELASVGKCNINPPSRCVAPNVTYPIPNLPGPPVLHSSPVGLTDCTSLGGVVGGTSASPTCCMLPPKSPCPAPLITVTNPANIKQHACCQKLGTLTASGKCSPAASTMVWDAVGNKECCAAPIPLVWF